MPAVRDPYFYPARDGGNHQQTRTNKYRRLPAVRAPYFYPARDGGNHQQTRTMNIADMQHDEPRIKTPPRTEADSRTQTNDTEARTRPMGTQRRLNDNKHVQASSREDHATSNPRGKGPARATRREADNENNPRIHNATGIDEPPDYDTVHAYATHEEASEHIGIHNTSNAHPDSPEAIVDRARQDEGCLCLANQPERAPYLYPAPDGGKTSTPGPKQELDDMPES